MVLELEPTATLCFSFAARPSRFGFTLFNAAFRAEGLDWLYKPVQVTTSAQLKDAVAGLRGLGARGCGVSMPWKTEICCCSIRSTTPRGRSAPSTRW